MDTHQAALDYWPQAWWSLFLHQNVGPWSSHSWDLQLSPSPIGKNTHAGNSCMQGTQAKSSKHAPESVLHLSSSLQPAWSRASHRDSLCACYLPTSHLLSFCGALLELFVAGLLSCFTKAVCNSEHPDSSLSLGTSLLSCITVSIISGRHSCLFCSWLFHSIWNKARRGQTRHRSGEFFPRLTSSFLGTGGLASKLPYCFLFEFHQLYYCWSTQHIHLPFLDTETVVTVFFFFFDWILIKSPFYPHCQPCGCQFQTRILHILSCSWLWLHFPACSLVSFEYTFLECMKK